MLSFLRRLFGWGGPPYRPKDRLLFRYWNGRRWVLADPLPLYKTVMDRGIELHTLSVLADSISKDAGKAREDLCAQLRVLFHVPPLVDTFEVPEEGTLSDTEVGLLLDRFLGFCEGVKKNSRTTPTLSAMTSEPIAPSSDVPPPTPSTSDSGSTDAGPPTEPPRSSDSAPKLPPDA